MMKFNTTTALLPHQQDAVNKVFRLRVGALFMEMGTGKSRTAIEIVKLRHQRLSNVVWACPVALKDTVKAEIIKHTDASDIYVFDERTRADSIPAASWYIVGIESLAATNRVAMALNNVITDRSMVIMDESSYIKGPFAIRTQRITTYASRARFRLILTGTPISQGIVDLFAQMKFLSPEILGYNSFYSFANNHLNYSEKYPGVIVSSHNVEYISKKIEPFVYQVTKNECMSLPEKTYDQFTYSMMSDQRDLYQRAKDYWFDRVAECRSEYQRSYIILGMFTALQQVACGFWHYRIGKGKWGLTEVSHLRLEYLDDAISRASGQVIIWSKYQHDIDQIKVFLDEKAITYSLFHGGVTEKNRTAEVARFKAGNARVFLSTPQCGGHGLTLNEADTVIFYSNGFKYSERIQAEDRSHRIGQTKPVLYIDLWADCGIEDRIYKALKDKGSVVDSFKREVEAVKALDKKSQREALKKLKEAL